MGRQGPSSQYTLEETLEVFDQTDAPGTPLTASEVADALGCVRRTAYGKLEELADRGDLETKEVGARGRVWWRPTQPGDDGSADPGSELAQAQFDELTETIADYAIFVLDADGRVQTWNEGARQIKGYEEAEIVGEHVSSFYTAEDVENGRAERNLQAAATQGRIEDEGWRVRADGTTFWATVTITALYDDDGEHRGFIKITRDMTERREYERRLQTEKERFETLVREVKDYAIFLLDEAGIVQTWNEGARQLKGYEEAEIVGEHVSTFYTDEDRAAGRAQENLDIAAEEGRVEDEGWRVRKDGTTFWANVIITALYDDEGDVRGYAKVTRDMTERHQYEERLVKQRDELDELDQINAVIRDIDQALVTASSREEIEQAVCDRLAASETYSAAWTAEYTDDYADISPRASAGISETYLESIRSADEGAADVERGVGATALQTRAIQPIQRLESDPSEEPWQGTSLDEGYESAITVPLVYNDVEYGILTVYADDESAFDERKIDVLSELGETISHAIAAIRRKEREQTLTALQDSTRELLHTESRREIGDIIVETLTDQFTLDDAVVYTFNTNENTLEPTSSSFQNETYTEQLVPLTAGIDSPVWTSFMDSETTFSDAVLPAREIGQRRSMIVPLGDHGVLAVATAEQRAFDDQTRNLVELVAATAEAAFDRLESQANLRERDELLQEQNQRLQRVNQINTIIREVDQGLVQATTREEIQRIVCDRLTRSDRFRFAWIATPGELDGRLTPAAWSGDGRGYLDAVEFADGTGRNEAEPTVAAFESDELQVVPNVAERLRRGKWRKEAFSREFQSVVSVPLTYDDVTHGVLTVYADRPDVFGEMERSVFAELGETIANTMSAVETKQAILGDQVVELEFRLPDASTGFLSLLARQLDCEISYEGAIPLTEGEARVFFVVRGADAASVDDVLERSVTVESSEVLGEGDDEHLVEAVVTGSSIPITLLEQGASLRELSVTDEGVGIIVELPSNTDTREFIERFRSRYENAAFVARRERDRSIKTPQGLRAELDAQLSDRQLEVLKTAYFSGFFASPRRSTGGDVADILGVSQPTVTEQLRTAQRKVFEQLFADPSSGA